jgi:hypothetical protein
MGRVTRLGYVGVLMVACGAALVTRPAVATLGQYQDSVENDRVSIAGVRHLSHVKGNFTVHEIANEGISVRQYARTDGTIFALSWSGDSHPDLSQLLGAYFSDYATASSQSPKVRVRTPFSRVEGTKVTVEKFGHLRAMRGRACVTELFPAGVTCEQIK